MDLDLEIFEFLEADNSAEECRSRKRRRMCFREEYDPFDLDEEEFRKRYRLTKVLARNLCDDIKPLMKKPFRRKSSDLTVETKVLIALSFYATGSYQDPIGKEGHFVAQQTVSYALAQVTACLNSSQIRQKYIKFPTTEQDRNQIKTKFYNKFHIPGVLGCIDCTHVTIIRPKEHKERYYCCKHYHSLNVQLICDADMQIMSVDASHGGATHDSLIWANHPLKLHMDHPSNLDNTWLLGDSGYPLRKCMMTPILNAEPDSPEAHYTDLHVRARNIIKRTIRLLKARFRCLLVHKVLHYSPQVAGSIVTACVILHNICNKAEIPVQQLSDEDLAREAELRPQHIREQSPPLSDDPDLQQGHATRQSLVQQLWEKRNLRS